MSVCWKCSRPVPQGLRRCSICGALQDATISLQSDPGTPDALEPDGVEPHAPGLDPIGPELASSDDFTEPFSGHSLPGDSPHPPQKPSLVPPAGAPPGVPQHAGLPLAGSFDPESANRPGSRVKPKPPARESLSDQSKPSRKGQRFFPGEVVADRYRILTLAGRGGMGEVYHAEDLRLGQDIALKFLPSELATRPDSLERLLGEARLARRVTHPNVCRVHDIGDIDGQLFLSMEYIEGENLSTLIKRIGRLPGDKALAVAHQICAGLQAAHDRGVVHRDLKPANVMLDAAGDAKIADFGLSGLTDQVRNSGLRAGTPAYMAPEQLLSKGATPRSDIYSLGLVLYELFTGSPVFRPNSIQELQELHESPIKDPSTIVADIDPAVERAIMWCLERDPERRPPDARAVSVALPGGLLSAQLMAGRVPSPEEVAAAGGRARVQLIHALLYALGITLLFAVGVHLSRDATLIGAVSLPKPIAALTDRAQQILDDLGYTTPPVDIAVSFDRYEELLVEMARQDTSLNRWDKLKWTRPAAIDYWYRQRNAPLLAMGQSQRVTYYDPPNTLSGCISMRLDPSGRIRELLVATEPAFYDAPATGIAPIPKKPVSPDWAPVFKHAGLDLKDFTPVQPQRVCPVFADTTFAWEGVYPEKQDEKIRVEADGYLGKPVFFRIVELNWIHASTPEDLRPTGWKLYGDAIKKIVQYSAIIGSAVLAWRNLRLRRGDRAGALHVGLAAFSLQLAASLLAADHVLELSATVQIVIRCIFNSVPVGLMFWVFYLGVEPIVRRTWPEMLISWTRFVSGNWRDPLVGLNVLVGVLGGLAVYCLALLDNLSPGWIGIARNEPFSVDSSIVDSIGRTPVAFSVLPEQLMISMQRGLETVVGVVLLKLLFGRKDAAAVAFAVVQAAAWNFAYGGSFLSWFFWSAAATLTILALVRFGFLALVVGLFAGRLLCSFPIALKPHTATSEAGVLVFLIIGVFVIYGVIVAGFTRPTQVTPISSGPSA